VIANSGISGPEVGGLATTPLPSIAALQAFLWEPSMEFFNSTFLANTTAMFYTLVAFLSLLDAGNSHLQSPTVRTGIKSQFIATSSIGAFSRKPGMGYAYAGSKAAVVHLVKQLSTGLVPYQIRVNCFAPGIYPSDMSVVSFFNSILRFTTCFWAIQWECITKNREEFSWR
jgi:NAD(P)-dependent dehydrogenase (short-subunit alcohol dehydrogenase family)